MRIAISFESETIPDYVRGETKAEDRILEINFDGERLESYSEYMDPYTEKKFTEKCFILPLADVSGNI